MKTLNSFLELYKPKSPDEQKFVDKHVIAKFKDRNGNKDDVFQATNVKMIDRKKTMHGHNPKEDAEVYEGTKVGAYYAAKKAAKKIKESEDLPSAEEYLFDLVKELPESTIENLFSIFDSLTEENQEVFIEKCETKEGLDEVIDFSISLRRGDE